LKILKRLIDCVEILLHYFRALADIGFEHHQSLALGTAVVAAMVKILLLFRLSRY
jgi:hypothetical protein